MTKMLTMYQKYKFMFSELLKRDFKKRYKRTFLGMVWSVLSPLLQLLVMSLVFKHFFGGEMKHYTIYLFSGQLIYGLFKESTNGGMQALTSNADIISKINVPKYIFLLSKNASVLVNFAFTLLVYFIFVIADGITITPKFILLIYPIVCLMCFNIGVGLILSAWFVFFKDTQYLYDIFTLLLMYMSAIFYPIDTFPPMIQRLFLLNPVFSYIHYFRMIVVQGAIPSPSIHLLCLGYALAALLIGGIIYKKNNYKFIFYI